MRSPMLTYLFLVNMLLAICGKLWGQFPDPRQQIQHEIEKAVARLQDKKAMLVWHFTCEVAESPLPESIATERISWIEQQRGSPLSSEEVHRIYKSTKSGYHYKAEGTVHIYQSEEKLVVEIQSRAPVLGYEDDPAKWLPTRAFIEFARDYVLVYDSSQIARVYKTSSGIYRPVPFGVECIYPFDPVDFVLLSGLSPFALYGATSQDWKSVGSSYVLTRNQEDIPNVRLQFSNKILRSIEISMGKKRSRYQIEETHASFVNLPTQIKVEKQRSHREIRAEFYLKRFDLNCEAPTLQLGTHVNDFRLTPNSEERDSEGFVHYLWTGELPTETELKQLAYQQGSLLPPETPQRRYSFWMFLPAIVLFGLALLFYLKRRR
jgi:hypothetical protein